MLAMFVAFIVIVLAITSSASSELVDSTISPIAPGDWPPQMPAFKAWNPPLGDPPGCEVVLLCMNVLAYWLQMIAGYLVGGIILIVDALGMVISLILDLTAFSLPGLPAELAWVNQALQFGMLIVIGLLIFRLIRSIIPFVSGE